MKIVKDIRKNTLLILLVTVIVMYLVLRNDLGNIINTLVNVNLGYILISFLLFFVYLFFRSYICYKTVDKKEQFSLLESFKHNVIVQFFNGVTPFSTGGQPMEVYMLTEHGVKGSRATMYILQNFIFYQVALVLFGLGAVIYNGFNNIFPKVPLLRELVLIGFLVNTLVAVAIFLVSVSKKFTNFLIKAIIFILSKLHIVKDKEGAKKHWEKVLVEFHDCAKILRTRRKLFVAGVVANLISLFALYIIPLFIVYSMGDFTSLEMNTTLTASAYVMLMGSFVPIPGGSGGIEYGFLAFFGNFLTSSKASTALLIWRFITYYLPMVIGAIAFNIDERGKKL